EDLEVPIPRYFVREKMRALKEREKMLCQEHKILTVGSSVQVCGAGCVAAAVFLVPFFQIPVLPNCMPSRWKAGGSVCRRGMRLSTKRHWSTSKSQCGLSMDMILKRACKNKYASGLLSVGKPYTKIIDTVFFG
ncbi:hypothetical protein cypCar_00034362, partial [Cyprinus carpio]